METVARFSLLVYAVLMSVGGIMGFVKGRSSISLIAGLASAAVLVLAYFISISDARNGLLLGVGVTSVLTFVFAIRIAKTKKIMPSGALLALTLLEEMLLLLGSFLKF